MILCECRFKVKLVKCIMIFFISRGVGILRDGDGIIIGIWGMNGFFFYVC